MSIGIFTLSMDDLFFIPTIAFFNKDGSSRIAIMWLKGGVGVSFHND